MLWGWWGTDSGVWRADTYTLVLGKQILTHVCTAGHKIIRKDAAYSATQSLSRQETVMYGTRCEQAAVKGNK